MKIIIDSMGPVEVEHHARHMVRSMYTEKRLPYISGVTRALIPGWCDDCEGRAWQPVLGGIARCESCAAEKAKENKPGF